MMKFDNGEELSKREQLIYRLWSMLGLKMWEMTFSRYQNGLLPDESIRSRQLNGISPKIGYS